MGDVGTAKRAAAWARKTIEAGLAEGNVATGMKLSELFRLEADSTIAASGSRAGCLVDLRQLNWPEAEGTAHIVSFDGPVTDQAKAEVNRSGCGLRSVLYGVPTIATHAYASIIGARRVVRLGKGNPAISVETFDGELTDIITAAAADPAVRTEQ